jgi:predicted DNA repair protein MutK
MVTLVPGSSQPCLAIGPRLSKVREGTDASDVIKARDQAITHHYGTVAMLWVGGHILLAGSDRLGWHPPHRFVHHVED